jgi:hypothetical protein
MPAGRPPTPTRLHRLHGTFRHDRHDRRVGEPQAEGELIVEELPANLRKLGADILLRAPHGLVRRIDRELFVRYLQLLDRYDRAERAQRKLDRRNRLPLLVEKDGVLAEAPYARMLERLTLLTLRLQTEMGFTPAARARIGAAQPPAEEPEQAWAKMTRFPVLDGKVA